MGSTCCKGSEKREAKEPENPAEKSEDSSVKRTFREESAKDEENKDTAEKSSRKEISRPEIAGLKPKKKATRGCLDPYVTPDVTTEKSSIPTNPLFQAISKLAVDLYLQFDRPNDNMVFSPFSIALALALVEIGATDQTRLEIQKLIGPVDLTKTELGKMYGDLQEEILKIPKEHGQLLIGNTFFRDFGLHVNKAYLDNVKKCLKTEIHAAPLLINTEIARQQINRWVSEKTMGKIPEFYKPGRLTGDLAFVLINAIYMKMDWATAFDAGKTKEKPFYRFGGSDEQKVLFMCGDGAPYMGREDFHAVELRYKGEALSMYVILPRRRDGIRDIEKRLSADFLWKLFIGTRHCRPKVFLEIPKFTVRFDVSLLRVLGTLGLTTLDQLRQMTDDPRVIISDATHQAYIKVDEKGTEALAVTAIEGGYISLNLPPPFVNFVADHPFLYVIVHKPTWTVVFMGKVNYIPGEES